MKKILLVAILLTPMSLWASASDTSVPLVEGNGFSITNITSETTPGDDGNPVSGGVFITNFGEGDINSLEINHDGKNLLTISPGATFEGDGFSITNINSETIPGKNKQEVSSRPHIYRNIQVRDIRNKEGIEQGRVTTLSVAKPVSGIAGSNVMMYGRHGMFISNQTNNAQSYRVKLEIISQSGARNTQEDYITLQANKEASAEASTFLNELFPSPGMFQYCAHTSISGESSHNSHSCAPVNVFPKS